MKFNKERQSSVPRTGQSPAPYTGWGLTGWGNTLWKRICRSCLTVGLTWVNCAHWQWGQLIMYQAAPAFSQSRNTKWFSPLLRDQEITPGIFQSVLGLPVHQSPNIPVIKSKFSRQSAGWSWGWRRGWAGALALCKRLRNLNFFSLEKTKALGETYQQFSSICKRL